MHKMFNTARYIFTLILLGTAVFAQAQQDTTLTKEVEVTKAYKPTLSDANKLNSMPTIDETEHQKPTFNYNINSQPVFSTFSVNPLKAAIVETSKDQDNGYGLVRAGLGTTFRPYGEVFFNNQNSRNSLFGIHAMHLSSFDDIELEGGNKVDAPFMKNEVDLFVKHLVQDNVLSVNLDFKHDAFNYYGYPLTAVTDPLLEDAQTINYFDTKQSFAKGGINIGLKNPTAEYDDATIGFDFTYHYFGTKTDQREHYANFVLDVQQPMVTGVGLLEGGVLYTQARDIYLQADSTTGNRSQIIIHAKPAWFVGDETANITLGVNTWFIMVSDEDTEAKISPNIRANWAPVPELINLYAGIDGDYVSNYYSKIAYENPFVDPEHDVMNSFQKFRFYGGFDGKFSKKTNFKISAEYAIIDNQPFYYLSEALYLDPAYNPAPSIVDNTFKFLYDNIDRLKLNAEVFHASSDKVDLTASVNYYTYKLDEQEEAWNLPKWDANLNIGYKVSEQLSLSADIFLMGERKALIVEQPDLPLAYPTNIILPSAIYKSSNLETAFDLNVKGNYQITNQFSVFAQLNNFGFQKYQRWFGYPVQSFNMLAGISYSF
ncbi:hypothetical protein LH29_21400 [Draconibacterium sediminis]|uniref:TonB-dependent receptor-like beta-barrel domain-containing protein n=2 Tax=Draconibacterium sediminis TaxID=1544798 RepID=A0A0D8J986_9BACT|nr:hypothetical protein LH29_21400 [Draconibacterium sediminis]